MKIKEILVLAGNLALAGALLVLFGLGKLTWEQAGAGIALLAFPSAATVIGKKGPPPTGGAVLLVLLCAAGLQACALFQEAKEAEAEKAYRDEQMACANAYDTRVEIEACRRGVRARWGIAETATKKDGGK